MSQQTTFIQLKSSYLTWESIHSVENYSSATTHICQKINENLDQISTSLSDIALNTSESDVTPVLQEINGGLNEISNLLSDIANNTSSISNDAIFLSIIVVLLGALLNYVQWLITKNKEKKEEQSKTIHSLIDELEKVAINYWLTGYNSSTHTENITSEIKIKSILKMLMNLSLPDESARKTSELYDIVTGGEFETRQRQCSKITASKISFLCTSLKINALKN